MADDRRLSKLYKQGYGHCQHLVVEMLEAEVASLRRNAARPGRAAEIVATDTALIHTLTALAKVLKEWQPSIKQRGKLTQERVEDADN